MCITNLKKIEYKKEFGWKVFEIYKHKLYTLWTGKHYYDFIPLGKWIKSRNNNTTITYIQKKKLGYFMEKSKISKNFGFFKTKKEAEEYQKRFINYKSCKKTIIKKIKVKDVYEGISDVSFNWDTDHPNMLCADWIIVQK